MDNGMVRLQLPLADGLLCHARRHTRGPAHHPSVHALQPLPHKAQSAVVLQVRQRGGVLPHVLLVRLCHGLRQGLRLVRQSTNLLGNSCLCALRPSVLLP